MQSLEIAAPALILCVAIHQMAKKKFLKIKHND